MTVEAPPAPPIVPMPPPIPLSADYKGQQAYLPPGATRWMPLTVAASKVLNMTEEVDESLVLSNRSTLADMFSAALQVPNLGFFAGSGTSLAPVGGPSMWELWRLAMCEPGSNDLTQDAVHVMEKVRYLERAAPNIEHFLSQCDAYLAFSPDPVVSSFVNRVKALILRACSDFLELPTSDISAYENLLQKLARRRVRDPRLKIFTTNYDMCFETAASRLGMVAIDGFSYTRKRRFDGKHFTYDIVRREADSHEFAEGIFHFLKLHGSVSWCREGNEIYEQAAPPPDKACLIYPAKGKYQQAFLQPHLELLSRFLEFLRQPNSCLVVAGFGFNDDHLSEPIYSAVKSNPSLKLVLCDYQGINHVHNRGFHGSSHYWSKFYDLAQKGFDVHFISGSFSDLVGHIPNIRTASPAEQLANAVKRISGMR
ncbi:hypothetical protein D3C78_535620 [compost metagenome]